MLLVKRSRFWLSGNPFFGKGSCGSAAHSVVWDYRRIFDKYPERFGMLTYKAMYKFLDQGVHAEVLDFPGTISCGETLQEARRLLASALADMAETTLVRGEPLPQPDPSCTDPEADLEEPIHLFVTAASHVSVAPQTATP